MSVLSKNEIKRLIDNKPPLVQNYYIQDEQLQPNGFDITLRDLAGLLTPGRIETDNSRRSISTLAIIEPDEEGMYELKPGPYVVTFNEIVNLPKDIMALGKPRSSLLRCGVAIHNAVWDAGYSGRSQALLMVYNPSGFCVQKNARVLQLIFLRLDSETEGYKGIYQGENTK
jgi:dUTP pyrophosphatase